MDTDLQQPTVTVNWQTPTATDNSGEVTVSCDTSSGSRFTIGQTVVTCLAIDTSGNNRTCSFLVNVEGNYKLLILFSDLDFYSLVSKII